MFKTAQWQTSTVHPHYKPGIQVYVCQVAQNDFEGS